jgi:hypothetical protein
MESEKYRISRSREEILKVLNEKFKTHVQFTIWQKNPETDERNFVIEAEFRSIDAERGDFSVFIEDKHKKKFNLNLMTYFLLKGQNFVFKTNVSKNQSDNRDILTFSCPKEIRLIEQRNNERKYFQTEEHFNVNVTFESKNEYRDIKTICQVYNISNGGICIIVSKETLNKINLQKQITIDGLGFFKTLGQIKKAIVRNARVFKKKSIKSDESFAIGLEFTEGQELPDDY